MSLVKSYMSKSKPKVKHIPAWQSLLESLLVILLLGIVTTLGASGGLGPLSLGSTWSATTVWRGQSVVDVSKRVISMSPYSDRRVRSLLGVKSDNERWDVDDLLADSDVSLSDKDTGVVDRLGESELEDLGLETSLQEILSLEGQHVIQSHSAVVEHTDSDQSSDQGVTLEKSLGVLILELEELSGSTSDLRGSQYEATG